MNAMKNIFKAVTFDVTNTIIKVKGTVGSQYASVAERHNISIDSNALDNAFHVVYKNQWNKHPNFGVLQGLTSKEWWDDVVQKSFLTVHCSYDTCVLNKVSDELFHHFFTADAWDILPGRDVVLQTLKNKNFCLGAISNFDERLPNILQCLGLLKYFNFVVTSIEAKVHKPDPAIFDYSLKKHLPFLRPEQVLHIGDNYKNDFVAPQNSGMSAYILRSSDRSKAGTGDYTAQSMTDIIQLLEYDAE